MRLLRTQEVCARIGCSRQTLWRMVSAGEFPARRYLTNRPAISGWLEEEVDAWLREHAQPVGADDGDEDA